MLKNLLLKKNTEISETYDLRFFIGKCFFSDLEWFIDFDKRSQDLNGDFTVKDCFFGAVNLTKKADWDKYSHSGYSIEFNSSSLFLLPSFDWGKNAIIFGVWNTWSVHIDNK